MVGDDAAGRHAAAAVASRALPGVRVLSLPQLAPEVADDLTGVDLAIFVDATVDDAGLSVRVVEPAPPSWRLTHHVTPSTLLALADALGTAPRAEVVSIPAVDLDLGTALSRRTARYVAEAVRWIVDRCRGHHVGSSDAAPATTLE
jgi:hydrogenase maturation protease